MTDLPSTHMVRVINRNTRTIEDMYDGVPYRFEPGKVVTIDTATAQHIFGYPGEVEYMHLYMSRRWGWNSIQHNERDLSDVPLWKRWCKNFDIRPVSFEMVERPDDPTDPIPVELGDAAVEAPTNPARSAEPSAPTRTGRGRRRSTPAKLTNQRGPQKVNVE